MPTFIYLIKINMYYKKYIKSKFALSIPKAFIELTILF